MRYTGCFRSCLLPLASCLLPLASCLLRSSLLRTRPAWPTALVPKTQNESTSANCKPL
ncbi:hypothetical protein [Moorena sp. SIO3B2]|uniref:hypothetical protein n=1 Tax=Moorena sp. SIO3B2 TaxID=2607827 RepID=UPI0013C86FE1|nr:hypothetical protein [Moorena sp. SIO3B2]NEP36283.1 hypothetical protein [Moorena sp. SIO3B2]